MISDPNLLRYACVAHQIGGVGGDSSTILAEYNNSGDSSLPELAQECLIRTPVNHSLFSHTIHRRSYTFLIDDPFVYFAISDSSLPKSERIWLLSGLKDAAQHLIEKHGKSILCLSRSFNSYCLQSQIHPILHRLVSDRGASSDTAVINGDGKLAGIACKVQSKGRRNFGVPLLVKMGEGLKKKKRLFGERGGESTEVLVEDKVRLSDQGEVAGKEDLSSGDAAGGKQKAKKIWRKHVWVVLVLDLTVCLILFGIWLMVCHGFQCIID